MTQNDDEILLTIFLKHDQSQNLGEINERLAVGRVQRERDHVGAAARDDGIVDEVGSVADR